MDGSLEKKSKKNSLGRGSLKVGSRFGHKVKRRRSIIGALKVGMSRGGAYGWLRES